MQQILTSVVIIALCKYCNNVWYMDTLELKVVCLSMKITTRTRDKFWTHYKYSMEILHIGNTVEWKNFLRDFTITIHNMSD